MRVAHLTTVHSRDDTRVFRKMCRSLAAAGHDVTLHVADGRGDEVVDAVRIVDAGRPANRVARATRVAARMWRQALGLRPDILHFHDPELIPGGLVARLLGRRVVYDIHEYYRAHLRETAALPRAISEVLARLYGVAERCASRFLDACVVVSPHMERALALRRCVVVGNLVRVQEFRPSPVPAAERPRQVCYVGVLSAARRTDLMVGAADAAATRLVLAGSWYPESLRGAVSGSPSWRAVDELGQIDRRRMQEVFDASRAGLLLLDLSGDEEHSSCNKLFEYMAAGLPVIATDLTFVRDVVERHGCGVLVGPTADAGTVAEAIGWVLDHPDEADRMGRAGRKAVEENYSWEREQEKLLALYEVLHPPGVSS